ncbi:MAG: M2 family metallopeptidase, partial [Planctomycetaceae bacterium]|nr:M2 family metallopeptidase [Planctomycetaceae bacterium]
MSFSHVVVTVSLGFLTMAAASNAVAGELTPNDARAKRFIEQYEATVRPLEIQMNLCSWVANVSGKEEDFGKKEQAEQALDLKLSEPENFAELKAIKEAGVSDPLLARQIKVLYLYYLERQIPPALIKKMSAKANAIQRAFNVFRPSVDGKELTDNDVRQVLTKSRDSKQRRAVWEASKKVGPKVLVDLKELIALRNEAARKLGFADFYEMRLQLGEQDKQQVLKLFDQLDELTRGLFHQAKGEMDAALAQNYGIAVDDLRPWHYHDPFFQEPPAVQGEIPESVYKDIDVVKLVKTFYTGIGLPINDLLPRCDLYEKPGKNPHAFCQDMNREGDVRVLENIVRNATWTTTTLHEFGHAVYSKNIPRTLPYAMRIEAHTLSTEGVAMMFERNARNVDWLMAMGVKVPDPDRYRAAAAKFRRNRLLVFSRWAQVMVHFEAALYANPDQDLNKLWWDLVEKYQELKRPEGRDEPDYAAKYHIVGAPVYYHNYAMGEMFASQMEHALNRAIHPGADIANASRGDWVNNKAVGKFMRERVFDLGMTVDWNGLARHVDGQDLNPKAFAEDL